MSTTCRVLWIALAQVGGGGALSDADLRAAVEPFPTRALVVEPGTGRPALQSYNESVHRWGRVLRERFLGAVVPGRKRQGRDGR